MADTAQTALGAALEYLTAAAADARAAGVVRLPALKSLAHRAGVGLETMWKALQVLKRDGVLEAAPHRGIRATGVLPSVPVSVPVPPPPETSASVRLAQRLRQRILEGQYEQDERLPSMKELCADLGTCHRTLKQALTGLEQQRLLARWKRGFVVPTPRARPGAGRVLLITARSSLRDPGTPYYRRAAEFIKRVEQECARRHVRLDYLLHSYEAREVPSLVRRLPGRGDVLGVVVISTGTAKGSVASVLGSAAGLGKPVSVLDEHGWHDVPSRLWTRRGFTLFTLSGRWAGRAVGRYLLGMGHRRVAFSSANAEDAWSRDRLAGLREAFAQAGTAGGVLDFSFTTAEEQTEAEVPHHRIRQDRSAGVRGRARDLVAAAHATYGDASGAADREVTGVLGTLSSMLSQRQRRKQLLPRIRELLSDRAVTALVAANDTHAILCLEALRDMRVAVPSRVSVVGFDDTLEALNCGLTSYNFNTDAVLKAMLNSILSGGYRPARPHAGPVELDGFVVERASSQARPARQPV